MPASPTRGQQARQQILEAARHLFLTQGYHGTSMRAIARAAGDRAVGGLYNHFATKEAIFQALIEETNPYDELFAVFEGALAGAEDAPEFLRRALRAVLEVMPRHYSFIQLAQIDMREFEGRTIAHVLQTQVLPRILTLIARMQALPGLRPLNPILWLRVMASLVIGFMITDQLIQLETFQALSRAEWADVFAEALLHGIADPTFPGATRP